MAKDAAERALESAWQVVRAVEPVRGKVLDAELADVRVAIEQSIAQLAPEPVPELGGKIAAVYGRAAAIAIAAGDEMLADRWLAAAEARATDPDHRAELAAARGAHERFRGLVHGRYLYARGRAAVARKAWKSLTKGAPDAIARAALEELRAPRQIGPGDRLPKLHRINGIGTGFYGRRNRWPDGSYATTQCFSIVWVPVFALGAWRVLDAGSGYRVLAREQLSRFARLSRWAVLGSAALLIAGLGINAYVNDPERLAGQRWDAALELAQHGGAEPALHELDGEIARDLGEVDGPRAERAGAEIVRLSSGYVGAPLSAERVDQAIRVVQRYQALPSRVRSGAAETAMFALVDGWSHQLAASDSPAAREAELALAGAASEAAPPDKQLALNARMLASRLALASAKQADAPLDALAALVDRSGALDPAAVAMADQLIERLDDAPSLLLDAGGDLDAWLAAVASGPLRERTVRLRDAAAAGQRDAEAEGVTPAKLAEMAHQRPWDQHVALQLARNEASAGKLDAAIARLAGLGAPGLTIRAARFQRAQLAAAQGKLEDADAQLTAVLAMRVQRFAAASAAVQTAAKAAEQRVDAALRTGSVPDDFRRHYEQASEAERQDIVSQWSNDQMMQDVQLSAARTRYVALGDVVPMALASGSIKLRRAQAMTGAPRDAMLRDAERAFLAIRTEAEGEPTFRLGLGEIYARLGKTKESDAEFAAVLAKHDAELELAVASVYRAIGSVARAKQISEQTFSTAGSPLKEQAAILLGILSEGDEDAAERWFRRSDQTTPQVKAWLLEIEGTRLERAGKSAECAAKFSAAAKVWLTMASRTQSTGHNNAALAYRHGFDCSGDPQALRDAQTALETAYRNSPEDPVIINNLADYLADTARVRVLARRVNTRALRLTLEEIGGAIGELLDGPERADVLADLTADPNLRRSDELFAQGELLMPNSPSSYVQEFRSARARRDVPRAAAVADRARHAKALDVSPYTEETARQRSGGNDAKRVEHAANTLARLDKVLAAPGGAHLDARTRATGGFVSAQALRTLGLAKIDPAALERSRDLATLAMTLWPALDQHWLICSALIDQAALEGDAKGWQALRQLRGSAAALDKLATEHAALADQVVGSKWWPQITTCLKGDRSTPMLDQLRLARRLKDPALEASAAPALDDPLVRLSLELNRELDPADETTAEDLAYLDRR
jgi:hypothetical protein